MLKEKRKVDHIHIPTILSFQMVLLKLKMIVLKITIIVLQLNSQQHSPELENNVAVENSVDH